MTLEIPAHFIHEIKTKGYDVIGVKAFLRKLMKFHRKKPSLAHSQLKLTMTSSYLNEMYDVIGVNLCHIKLMRFHFKKVE